MASYGNGNDQMTSMNPKFGGEAPTSFPDAFANSGIRDDEEVNPSARLAKIVSVILATCGLGLLLFTMLYPSFFSYSVFGTNAYLGLIFAKVENSNLTQMEAEFFPTKQSGGKFIDQNMFICFLFIWVALGFTCLYLLSSLVVYCKTNAMKPSKFEFPLLLLPAVSIAVSVGTCQVSDSKKLFDSFPGSKMGEAQMTLYAAQGVMGAALIISIATIMMCND